MTKQSRRKFMRHSLLGIAALPLGASILSQRVFAQELTPLDSSAAQAKALRNRMDGVSPGSRKRNQADLQTL